MKHRLSDIILPIALGVGLVIAASARPVAPFAPDFPMMAPDTVTYPNAAYKLNRRAKLEEYRIADSLLTQGQDSIAFEDDDALDTLPPVKVLTARDTIKVPDSLQYSDPFRYKYYVAIIDSLTHRIVVDSLKHSGDSLIKNFKFLTDPALDTLKTAEDTLMALADSTHGEQDLFDSRKVDTLYLADSTAKAKAAFLAWYNSLDKDARKRYDREQKEKAKMAERDSLNAIKEEKKALKDSIRENTPRILETYAVSDTFYYKRIFAWTEDRDFQDLKPFEPDTSFNYHFHDMPFQRKDVNASWLGVAGSPVQYYNWFNRTSVTGVEFWEANESWTFSPQTILQYNTKTPHTELAYYGTLMSTLSKESDNVHILTTQNITPETNFHILYDRWGGGGILTNEEVKNKTFTAGINHIGKKYVANAGFISNTVSRGENGGLYDPEKGNQFWVRDTTVEVREYPIRLAAAHSDAKKMTLYADQQLRVPFTFINDLRARKDSTFVPKDDEDVTTAFVGHAIEWSKFQREYALTKNAAPDSVGQTRLDNKLYLRLQPWSQDAIVSKIDVGIGDYFQKFNKVLDDGHEDVKENSMYFYAGARGKFESYIDWNATARTVFAGADAGNSEIKGHLEFRFFPFRKARRSPVSFGADASSTLLKPNFYQRYSNTANFKWDSPDLGISSTTRIEGYVDIPWWKMDAKLGVALLAGNLYYGTDGKIAQNSSAMSVVSGYVRKEFVIADFFHMDNRLLAQFSSNQEVVPLPALSANLRWYGQFPIANGVMTMQLGVEAWANTKWYSSAWNPELGVFHNQTEYKYNNGPYFDVFMNAQWKTCVLFVRAQNLTGGWPLDRPDLFSAHNYIITEGGGTGVKIGIWWPFYTSPQRNRKISK